MTYFIDLNILSVIISLVFIYIAYYIKQVTSYPPGPLSLPLFANLLCNFKT